MFLDGILARGRTPVKTAQIRRIVRWLPVFAWMAGIFWLSQQSTPLGAGGDERASIVAHLALYAGLALLLSIALMPGGHLAGDHGALWLVPPFAFAIAVLYGTLDEVHQAFISGRTASTGDLGLDAAGATLGATLAFLPDLRRAVRR